MDIIHVNLIMGAELRDRKEALGRRTTWLNIVMAGIEAIEKVKGKTGNVQVEHAQAANTAAA